MQIHALFLLLPLVGAFQASTAPSCNRKCSKLTAKKQSENSQDNDRRSFVTSITGVAFLASLAPQAAYAGIDPNALRNLPVKGDESGGSTRLRQIDAVNKPVSDSVDKPWEDLAGGIQYREYREGKGIAVVEPGSKVAVEMTIRCKSFSTNDEPGGIKYYTTKQDTEFNEYAFTVGAGQVIPGLEEGMKGMRKGGLRRIEVPSTMVFAAKKADQLPLPTTKDGKRRFENLFKTDGTLIFEVLVTRVK